MLRVTACILLLYIFVKHRSKLFHISSNFGGLRSHFKLVRKLRPVLAKSVQFFIVLSLVTKVRTRELLKKFQGDRYAKYFVKFENH